MTINLNVYRLPVKLKRTADFSRPHVQVMCSLFDIFQSRGFTFRIGQHQANHSQMQAVRIFAEIVARCFSPWIIFQLMTVGHLPAFHFKIFERFGAVVAFGIGVGMPAPVGLGSQRYAIFIVRVEGLQPGQVGGKGELTISNRQRSQ